MMCNSCFMANFLNDDHLSQPAIAKIQVHPCVRTEFIYAEIAIDFQNKRRRKKELHPIKHAQLLVTEARQLLLNYTLLSESAAAPRFIISILVKNSPTTHDRKANEIKTKQTNQM